MFAVAFDGSFGLVKGGPAREISKRVGVSHSVIVSEADLEGDAGVAIRKCVDNLPAICVGGEG